MGDLQGPPIANMCNFLYGPRLWEWGGAPPPTSHLFFPSKGVGKAGPLTINGTKQIE